MFSVLVDSFVISVLFVLFRTVVLCNVCFVYFTVYRWCSQHWNYRNETQIIAVTRAGWTHATKKFKSHLYEVHVLRLHCSLKLHFALISCWRATSVNLKAFALDISECLSGVRHCRRNLRAVCCRRPNCACAARQSLIFAIHRITDRTSSPLWRICSPPLTLPVPDLSFSHRRIVISSTAIT